MISEQLHCVQGVVVGMGVDQKSIDPFSIEFNK